MLTNGHKDMGVRLMVGIWGVRMISRGKNTGKDKGSKMDL